MNQNEIANISKYYPERLQVIEAEIDYRDESFIENVMNNLSESQIKAIQEKGLDFYKDLLKNATNNRKIKEILVKIIFVGTIESYRFLESFFHNCPENIKAFAYLTMTKSRFVIESQFFTNDQIPIYVCSGLGGKDNKLKYFVSYIFDKDLTANEFSFLAAEVSDYLKKQYNCEIELINFLGKKFFFYTFFPIHLNFKQVVEEIRQIIADLDTNEIKNLLISNDKIIIDKFLKINAKRGKN